MCKVSYHVQAKDKKERLVFACESAQKRLVTDCHGAKREGVISEYSWYLLNFESCECAFH